MKRTLVYVGPTLSLAEVARILPSALVQPPVAVGDLMQIVLGPPRERPARIAIIDGYFERMAAVWHKEILRAMELGIDVWGASSMGALRAAELAPFGMRGVGAIYKAFERGTLTADDEVAVAHLPAEHGYTAVSVALVDLRAAIAAAPMLTKVERERLVDTSRKHFYRDRTWEQLVEDGRAWLATKKANALAAWIGTGRPSRKAADARLLLRTLAKTPAKRPPTVRVPRTWAIKQLENWLDDP
ncbi:MAG TPA: TfuA-like protein [Kofleriaceae bacterium]|jgi:hypothetical protein